MGKSIREIKEKTEELIEIGKRTKQEIQRCQERVSLLNSRVAEAKRQLAAASEIGEDGNPIGDVADAKVQLSMAESQLAASRRALSVACQTAVQNSQQKGIHIQEIELLNLLEKSNLEEAHKLRSHAFGLNSTKLIKGMIERQNDLEDQKVALLHSLDNDAIPDYETDDDIGPDFEWTTDRTAAFPYRERISDRDAGGRIHAGRKIRTTNSHSTPVGNSYSGNIDDVNVTVPAESKNEISVEYMAHMEENLGGREETVSVNSSEAAEERTVDLEPDTVMDNIQTNSSDNNDGNGNKGENGADNDDTGNITNDGKEGNNVANSDNDSVTGGKSDGNVVNNNNNDNVVGGEGNKSNSVNDNNSSGNNANGESNDKGNSDKNVSNAVSSSNGSKSSNFISSNAFDAIVNVIAAAQIIGGMLGAFSTTIRGDTETESHPANLRAHNMNEAIGQQIFNTGVTPWSDNTSLSEKIEQILAIVGKTFDNFGFKQDDAALKDPAETGKEMKEKMEEISIVNNTPTISGGKGNGGDGDKDGKDGNDDSNGRGKNGNDGDGDKDANKDNDKDVNDKDSDKDDNDKNVNNEDDNDKDANDEDDNDKDVNDEDNDEDVNNEDDNDKDVNDEDSDEDVNNEDSDEDVNDIGNEDGDEDSSDGNADNSSDDNGNDGDDGDNSNGSDV